MHHLAIAPTFEIFFQKGIIIVGGVSVPGNSWRYHVKHVAWDNTNEPRLI
jgi:hypothetical protein